MAISGDTGPTHQLWELLNRTPDLKALLLETSFPDELQDLADISATSRRGRCAASWGSSTGTEGTCCSTT